MPILRGHNGRRSSEGDVALMQMQIAAQARNQRWHDFLCGKREELQARLRQQGHAQSGLSDSRHERHGPDVPQTMQGRHDVQADGTSGQSTQWGVPGVEADNTLDTDHYDLESQAGDDGDDGEDREYGEYKEHDGDQVGHIDGERAHGD